MPTKYDVFAEIIKKAPCKPKDLSFDTPIYSHLSSLLKESWIRKNKQGYLIPIRSDETDIAFKLVQWSLRNNINYNIWFSENLKRILSILPRSLPNINPKELSNNQKNIELITFLGKNQFIVLWKRKPKLGTLLNSYVFDLLIKKHKIKEKINEKFLLDKEVIEKISKLKKKEINPFDVKIFEFLAGSAQLEGSTVSISETVDLILNSIYPKKPSKDIQMVKNLNEAIGYVIDHIEDKITINHIKELNRLSLFSLHKGAGQFKKVQNKILGNPDFKTTIPPKVPQEMKKFCDKINKIKDKKDCLKKIGFIHNELQRIHPFVDGNSRTTRLLVNWLLMKFKLPLLILKTGAFDKYMSLTKLSKKRDDFLLQTLLLHLIYHEELNSRL